MHSLRRSRISRRSGRQSVLLQRRRTRRSTTDSVPHVTSSTAASVISIQSTRTASTQILTRRFLSARQPRPSSQAQSGRRLLTSSSTFRSSGRRSEQFLARSQSFFGRDSALHAMSSSHSETRMQSRRMTTTETSRPRTDSSRR